MILRLELGPLNSLQVFLPQLHISRQLGLEPRVLKGVFLLDNLGVDLPLDVDDLGGVESQDGVGLSLLNFGDFVWPTFNVKVCFKTVVAEELTFAELRYLELFPGRCAVEPLGVLVHQ